MSLPETQNESKNEVPSNRLAKYIPLPWLRALQGLILSIGAPLGWMCVQVISGRDPFAAEHMDSLLYAYMSIATGVVFSGLGYFIGRRENIITDLALVDGLTGLYNKRYFENRLFQEFSRYKRTGRQISLIQLDLDHFKNVNDTWGHQAGDEVLKQVAQTIMSNCRADEIAARVGGEEMCIIAIDCDTTSAKSLSERLRHEIETNPVHWQDVSIALTSSFGVAMVSEEVDSALELFQHADKALYHAKKTGRNKVCVYDPKLMG